jgi:hypothetical protein
MNRKSISSVSFVAVASVVSSAALAQTGTTRPATSAISATTCLEKLASGASKQVCEQSATSRRSTSDATPPPGATRDSFLNPRSPGRGVVTTAAVADASKGSVINKR